ncbi:hypothetical protein I4U23_009720 [Adineta vaga]|nr:hypothetical protein I4U23_009720 [Adineta vaga]
MQSLIIFFTTILFAIHIQLSMGMPLKTDNVQRLKRSDDTFLPNDKFALITNEKLQKLKQFADLIHDPKLLDLYNAVNHYVQSANKNNEHVLWKYDANQEGLVLSLQPNLSGILYYG